MLDCHSSSGPLIRFVCSDEITTENCWFGVGKTPVGPAVIVAQLQTVLALWLSSNDPLESLQRVQQRYGCLVTRRDDQAAQALLTKTFEEPLADIEVAVSGSRFDMEVWHALCQIPRAQQCSYGDLAKALARPGAARAVGSALARNIVAYLIPCHRVVRHDGVIGQFRWGAQTKRDLLDWEQCDFIQGHRCE